MPIAGWAGIRGTPAHSQAGKYEFIYKMPEMLEFAKECGPNVGLTLDAWHWYHAGGTTADILARQGADCGGAFRRCREATASRCGITSVCYRARA